MARLVAERGDVIPVLGEIFREHGFEGASLALISARTGLGKGSLYHFFPGGKEEMAAAVLDEIAGWFEHHVYGPLDHLAPEAAIPAMFATVAEYFRSGRRVCLIGAFALGDSRDRFPLMVRQYFDRWLAALEGCLVRRGLGAARARSLARAVVAGIQGGIILTRALDDDGPFLETIARLERECLGAAA